MQASEVSCVAQHFLVESGITDAHVFVSIDFNHFFCDIHVFNIVLYGPGSLFSQEDF